MRPLLGSHCAKGDGGLEGGVQFFEPCLDRASVAVQESREQGGSHRPGLLYDRFCASADAMGCFGTQIWIRRSSGIVLDDFKSRLSAIGGCKGQVSRRGSLCHLSTCAPQEFHTLSSKAPFGSLEFRMKKLRTRTVPFHSSSTRPCFTMSDVKLSSARDSVRHKRSLGTVLRRMFFFCNDSSCEMPSVRRLVLFFESQCRQVVCQRMRWLLLL